MTTQSTAIAKTEEALTEAAVRKLSSAKNEPEWLLKHRLAAFKAFQELPLPQPSYGLHVRGQLAIDIANVKPLETITHNKGWQVDDVIIEDLSVAATRFENVLRPLITQNSEYRDKLEALFAAFWNNGIFVYAPRRKDKQAATKAAIELKQSQTTLAAIVVVAEENANIAITESLTDYEGNAQSYRIEGDGVIAGPNATVKFATIQRLGEGVNSLLMRRSAAEKDAAVDWADISIGGGITRQETEAVLNGEGATSSITGAFFGGGKQELDLLAKEVHNARNTTSNIKIKGALQGKSKAIVQSFTKIAKNASNSQGHQKASVLLLSDTARAAPIPKLEIDNYDVKASHEASVGQLDSEKLFYMMSRGIGRREAVKLVVAGFFEPLLRELPGQDSGLRQAIEERVQAAGEGQE